FTLSKYHPVGIMIYGNAAFMEVPWETIIKIYRNDLSKKQFDTLEEHADDFINFLDGGNKLFPISVQKMFLHNDVLGYFTYILSDIKRMVKEYLSDEVQISKETLEQIVSKTIKKHYEVWKKASDTPSIPNEFGDVILNKYEKLIEKDIKNVFESYPLSDKHLDQLKMIAIWTLLKFSEAIERDDMTGIVIAGFGKNNIFPSLVSYHLERIINNKLKYKKDASQKIDFETGAAIMSFAQGEMVHAFMEGVDPKYKTVKDAYISQIFDDYAGMIVSKIEKYTGEEKRELEEKLVEIGKQIVKDLNNELEIYRRDHHIAPIINVVSGLPKDELAAMAESLVNLTSFKRKVTPESETVGGPIDVALISKGDGFIWVKRKHYFKAELNHQFHENYYQEDERDE
ncbi:MAG: hypothetical protein ACXQT2_04840, partial [Methanotrichaceae archaeon]